MELKEKYPQLNKSLISYYGSNNQLEQSSIDRLIQFVITLSDSENEPQRKEVNSYEKNKKEVRFRKSITRTNQRTSQTIHQFDNKKRYTSKETTK